MSKQVKATHVSREHMFEGALIAVQQAKLRSDIEAMNAALGHKAGDYAARIKKEYGADLALGDHVNFDTGEITYAADKK